MNKLAPDIPDKIYVLASNGLNNNQIAAGLGITDATLRRWLRHGKNPNSDEIFHKLVAAFNDGKKIYRENQFQSMLTKNNGY